MCAETWELYEYEGKRHASCKRVCEMKETGTGRARRLGGKTLGQEWEIGLWMRETAMQKLILEEINSAAW